MTAPSARTQQSTVLLVEDDELARDALTRILVRAGYMVLTAESAHDAIGQLHAPLAPVDAILLDIALPDISGANLCARLRELQMDIPVIVCTGLASPEEAEQLKEMGIHHYFCKPVPIPELLAALKSTVRSRQG
jgi:two-component system nitrogen regulation response regulator NtrX